MLACKCSCISHGASHPPLQGMVAVQDAVHKGKRSFKSLPSPWAAGYHPSGEGCGQGALLNHTQPPSTGSLHQPGLPQVRWQPAAKLPCSVQRPQGSCRSKSCGLMRCASQQTA